MPDRSEQWSSRAGFIFASMGSLIGLGSIWKFPYEVGTNGGGGFVLFYLLGLLLIVYRAPVARVGAARRRAPRLCCRDRHALRPVACRG